MKVIDIKEYKKRLKKLKELTKTVDPLLEKMSKDTKKYNLKIK